MSALFWSADALCLFYYDTHLASIHNSTQNEEAKSLCNATTKDCWIGLTDETAADNFEWTDGTLCDYGTDISGGKGPWSTGEPSGTGSSGEPFVRISDVDDGWRDTPEDPTHAHLCNYPSAIKIIWDTSGYQRIPTLGASIGFIDVLDEIYVGFNVIIYSWPTHPSNFGNILRIGNSDILRCPAIGVTMQDVANPKFHFSFSRIANWSLSNSQNSAPIELNTSYNIQLYVTQNRFQLSLDNLTFYDNVADSHSILFDQNIYLANPEHEAVDCTVSNLKISTSNLHIPNGFNYLCDYSNRFSVIKGDWSIDAANCILHQNNATGKGNVVWLGDIDSSSLLWTDYAVEIVFNIASGQAGGILIRSQSVSAFNNGGKQYDFYLDVLNKRIRMLQLDNDIITMLHSYAVDMALTLVYGTDYTLRVEAVGDTFAVYFNNDWIFTKTANLFGVGSVGLRTYQSSAEYKSLRITFPTNKDLITAHPTITPTIVPSESPTKPPTKTPTDTHTPSNTTTNVPSESATQPPTKTPATATPSGSPSDPPSSAPSKIPSNVASLTPSISNMNSTSSAPSFAPSRSRSPSISPTLLSTNTTTTSMMYESTFIISTQIEVPNATKDNGETAQTSETDNVMIVKIMASIAVILLLILFVVIFIGRMLRKKKKKQAFKLNAKNMQQITTLTATMSPQISVNSYSENVKATNVEINDYRLPPIIPEVVERFVTKFSADNEHIIDVNHVNVLDIENEGIDVVMSPEGGIHELMQDDEFIINETEGGIHELIQDDEFIINDSEDSVDNVGETRQQH